VPTRDGGSKYYEAPQQVDPLRALAAPYAQTSSTVPRPLMGHAAVTSLGMDRFTRAWPGGLPVACVSRRGRRVGHSQ
jgi:hypothetical protein